MIFYTIGVYGLTEEAFFEKLINNDIDLFCDVRQRRGMRGGKYKFVNSIKLQEKISKLNINYLYMKQLAPTSEIRDMQKIIDRKLFESKHGRHKLDDEFIKEYKKLIINNGGLSLLIDSIKINMSENIALFCVEEKPKACHRSIISDELHKKGYEIRDL